LEERDWRQESKSVAIIKLLGGKEEMKWSVSIIAKHSDV